MAVEYVRQTSGLGQLPVSSGIIYHNAFDDLIALSEGGTGGDTVFELDPSLSFSGASSLLMSTRATAAAPNDFQQALFNTPLPPSGLVTFALRYRSGSFATMQAVKFEQNNYDGDSRFKAQIFFDPQNDVLRYLDADNVPQLIPGFTHPLTENMWHFFRLTCDFSRNQYVSLEFDELLFDMSGIPMLEDVIAAAVRLESFYQIQTAGAAAVSSNIDEFTIIEGRLAE